jgi:hypothetical protein
VVEDCQRNRPATPLPNAFMITGAVFTIGRNPCSRSAGTGVHDRLERVFTIGWNTHCIAPVPEPASLAMLGGADCRSRDAGVAD